MSQTTPNQNRTSSSNSNNNTATNTSTTAPSLAQAEQQAPLANNNNNSQENTNNNSNNGSPSTSSAAAKPPATIPSPSNNNNNNNSNNAATTAPATSANNNKSGNDSTTTTTDSTAKEQNTTTTTTTTAAESQNNNNNKTSEENSSQQTTTTTIAQPPASSGTAAITTGSATNQQQAATTTTTTTTATTASTATTTATPGRARPVIQLTQNLNQLYHDCNEKICHKKRQEAPGQKYNDGYDDHHGHYVFLSGEEIIGRYIVIETLGKGSFGVVVRCFDTRRKEIVAAKITRSGAGFRNQAKLEIDILMRILTQSPDSKIVRILKAFDWKGHLVIVFELLSFNLYQLMQCTNYHGVSLDLTSKFAFQLLMVLRDLERMSPPVIHCDLKPENVLLVNQNRSAIRVIDFGSACYQHKRMFRYIQSRYYRSPEVILGLEYGTQIDRWSLGCILVELHTGVPLFDGRNEAQQLQRFEGLLGPVPNHMIAASSKRDNFYETIHTEGAAEEGGEVKYKLKLPPEPQHVRTLAQVLERTQRRRGHGSSSSGSGSSSSAAAAGSSSAGATGGDSSSASASAGAASVAVAGTSGNNNNSSTDNAERYDQFIDLMKKLLDYDPAKRIGVLPAMEHAFLCEFMPYYLQRTANQQQHAQQQGSSTASSSQQPQAPPQQQGTTTTTTTTASSSSAPTTTATITQPSKEVLSASTTQVPTVSST